MGPAHTLRFYMCGVAIHNEWQPRVFSESSALSLRVVAGLGIAMIAAPTATRRGVNLALRPA